MSTEEKKDYGKEYRKRKVHRVIIFSQEQYHLLLKLAQKQQKPFSTMVRELAIAQASNNYVLPLDSQTHEVKILLIKYGSNLNQIAHISNSKLEVSSESIAKIQVEFKALQKAITAIYDKPIRVNDLVRNTLIKTPSYASEIKAVLTQLHL